MQRASAAGPAWGGSGDGPRGGAARPLARLPEVWPAAGAG
jgi:hypothetical protein